MSLDADAIVDRRRMRRKLTFWRVVAVLVGIGAVAAIALALGGGAGRLAEPGGSYIARVTIQGIILGDRERVEALQRLATSRARAVIVHVDSPGGTTAGSEQLFDALREVADKKPTVVVVDGLAASGGYITAMSADHIIAHDTSLVGSIGVLFQYPNVSDLLGKIGVKVEEIKSSPLKASPNGFEPTSPEARAAIEAIVKDSYDWFRTMVKNRRKLDDAALDRVADGRVFTGHQGIELKLVDEIGNEKTAIDWLAKEKNIDPKLKVQDWQLRSRFSELPFLHVLVAAGLDAVGLPQVARRILDMSDVQAAGLNLDGLLALWQPSVSN
ncbi:MAG TPA: signal peptide peptidase SppA [Xanthobacteraceae bacterium]|nr:signal peptide peptidase SppA [Xanthobacteraceae bacterium]